MELKVNPALLMVTVLPGAVMAVLRNQGSPSPSKMSKTLLPTELEIAMSPSPEMYIGKYNINERLMPKLYLWVTFN